MLRKRTDEVSRLTSTWSSWMMFKWSDLGRLREYLLIGLKRGMPWRVTITDRLEYEVVGLDKPPSNKLSLKYEINQKHENIIITQKIWKNIENIDWGEGRLEKAPSYPNQNKKLLATRTRTHPKPVQCCGRPPSILLHVLHPVWHVWDNLP